MKKASFFAVLMLLATSLFAQAWKGTARVQGTVTDENGKPVAGATVQLRSHRGGGAGPDIKTNDKGKWAALGLTSGPWDVDVQAEGYETAKLSIELSEVDRMPPMNIKIKKIAPVEPEPQKQVEQVQIGGQAVAPEIAAAVEAGNRFVAEGKFKEAVVEYEKAHAVLTTNTPLKLALARAYYGAGEMKKAIALLKDAHTANPSDSNTLLLLANLLLESGALADAKTYLDNVPAGTISDPAALINIGKFFYNDGKGADAHRYFDAAVTLDANRAESYYYRGLSLLMQEKSKEAKADFQKVIALAPESGEAKEAAEFIKSIK